jgi:F0F1-type ATP synthase assembly protein I
VARRSPNKLAGVGDVLALAWSLGWRIAAGLLLGYYLDLKLGTSPVLTLTLSIAAMVVAVRQMLAVLNEGAGDRRSGDGGDAGSR